MPVNNFSRTISLFGLINMAIELFVNLLVILNYEANETSFS
jgi:hypothetical protein